MSNNRSKYKKDYSQEDEELEVTDQEIELDQKTPVQDHEDLSWKKRYGDLRTYVNNLQQESKKTQDEFQKKIDALSQEKTKIPVNEEEFVEWVNTYPKVASMMEIFIQKKATELESKIKTIETDNNKRSLELKKQEAKMKLSKAHPDFYESIAGTKEFQNWASEKIDEQKAESNHSWVENALFDPDGTDWKTAADAISLYKAEAGLNKTTEPKNKANSKDAARQVNTNSGSSTPSSKGSSTYEFTESQIQNMSEREYMELEDKIDMAARNGRIQYDLSGAAR